MRLSRISILYQSFADTWPACYPGNTSFCSEFQGAIAAALGRMRAWEMDQPLSMRTPWPELFVAALFASAICKATVWDPSHALDWFGCGIGILTLSYGLLRPAEWCNLRKRDLYIPLLHASAAGAQVLLGLFGTQKPILSGQVPHFHISKQSHDSMVDVVRTRIAARCIVIHWWYSSFPQACMYSHDRIRVAGIYYSSKYSRRRGNKFIPPLGNSW